MDVEWCELCLICGISGMGPGQLYPQATFCSEVNNLADRILKLDARLDEVCVLDKETLLHMLRSLQPLIHFPRFLKPMDGKFTAIGHFDDTGFPAWKEASVFSDDPKILDGINAKEYPVTGPRNGTFIASHCDYPNGRILQCSARDTQGFGNFFVCTRCYVLLQAWLDVPAPSHNRTLSFAGEFYEVVNSRKHGRDPMRGTLLDINYDGVEETLELEFILGSLAPASNQQNFRRNLREPRHTVERIRQGYKGVGLIPAIKSDFRCWMVQYPGIWPTSLQSYSLPSQLHIFDQSSMGLFEKLPFEIFNLVVSFVPLISYFSLCRTSRAIFNYLSESANINRIFRDMTKDASRPLFWLNPVQASSGEALEARRAEVIWRLWAAPAENSQQNRYEGGEEQAKLCQDAWKSFDFPMYDFVRACYNSDSMKNRKRIWGIVKQIEGTWRDYRLNGWEVNRFDFGK